MHTLPLQRPSHFNFTMAPPPGPLGSASAPTDDSDLEELISSPMSKNVKMVDLDSLTGDNANGGARSGGGFMNPLYVLTGACQLCLYTLGPRTSKCLLYTSAFLLLAVLSNTLFNPTAPTGIMGADYSAIASAYDLSLAKVHHWCIAGDNDSCKCEDPLEPTSRMEFKSWNAAHKANVADVNLYRAMYGSEPTMIDADSGRPRPPIDVAFLGESVVEAMDGRWLGKHVVTKNNGDDKKKPKIDKTFEKFFRKEKGAPVEGVALGIAGDGVRVALCVLNYCIGILLRVILREHILCMPTCCVALSFLRHPTSFGVFNTMKCPTTSTQKYGGSLSA